MTAEASQQTRRLGAAIAALMVAIIVLATCTPLPEQAAESAATALFCLPCGEYGGVDVVLNVLLFIPLGFGLRLAGLRTGRAVLAGFALSLTVETLQFAAIPGRDASLSDLLTNTLGTAVGALGATRLLSLLRPGVALARRLTLAGAAGHALVVLATSWLLQPYAPFPRYWSQWAHHYPNRPPFPGTVQRVAVSGTELPDGPVTDAPSFARALSSSALRLEVDGHAGGWTPAPAPVALVSNGEGIIVLELNQAGGSLIFSPYTRSARFGLHRPSVRLLHALGAEDRGPVSIVGERQGNVLQLTRAAGDTVRSRYALGPNLAWSFFLGFALSTDGVAPWLSALTLLMLVVPIGFWSGVADAGRGVRWTAVAAASVALAQLLAPQLVGGMPASGSEVALALVGVAAGRMLARVAAVRMAAVADFSPRN